ncbi:MAG: RNA methyltransferase [Acidimicrobiia bacterium]|nr:RNA methyltransferase [Acidimicrobiia bacterium]
MTGSDADDPSGDILEWFRDLRSREAERRARNADVFYGESPGVIARLVAAGVALRSVLVLERRKHLLADIDTGDADVFVLTDPDLRDLVGFDMHRGMVGLFERPRSLRLDQLTDARLVCIVEGVGDDANMGAIVRTAAALQAEALVLDDTSADPFTRRAVRVSMGAVGLMPIVRAHSWPPSMPDRTVLAMTPAGEIEIGDVQLAGRVAVAVGSEGPGLSQVMLDASDLRVRIEMGPRIDSLSVSHAAAIALHHVKRELSQNR